MFCTGAGGCEKVKLSGHSTLSIQVVKVICFGLDRNLCLKHMLSTRQSYVVSATTLSNDY